MFVISESICISQTRFFAIHFFEVTAALPPSFVCQLELGCKMFVTFTPIGRESCEFLRGASEGGWWSSSEWMNFSRRSGACHRKYSAMFGALRRIMLKTSPTVRCHAFGKFSRLRLLKSAASGRRSTFFAGKKGYSWDRFFFLKGCEF